MKMDNTNKDKKVSNIWNDYLSRSSAHSLSQVPLAQTRSGRLYWYLLFLGVLVVASYQSALLLVDYLSYPILMNIKIVNEPNLVFPSVTICNQNRLMASKVKGSRFEEIPNIDKAFCACRYVGGLGNTARRKRRSTSESCIEDHELGMRWETWLVDNKKRYLERFGREYNMIRQEMPNHSEHEVLNELHGRLIEPLKKRIKRDHVMDIEEEQSEWIDYSKVNGENDWWGLLNATTADNFASIGNLIRASVNETKHLGHQPEDFIVQCSFDNSPCSYKDFLMFQHKRYGNCFTFNHGTRGDRLRFTSRSGSSYGLKLTLFIDQEEYIGLLTPEAGVRATVHRPYTVPFPEDDGLDCRPGTATTFGIRQHQILRTHYPYGGEDCVDQVLEKDAPMYRGEYSFLSCTKTCIQRELLKNCHCVDDINTILEDAKICDIMIEKDADCVNAVYHKFEEDRLRCNCNQLCNETYYTSQYSATLWPSDQHEGYLYADIASKSSKVRTVLNEAHKTAKNVVRINIIYMELNKEVLMEVEKYEIWDLLSSLGGSMGLYVGMSVISFIELFGVVVAMISQLAARFMRQEKTPITHVLPPKTQIAVYENIDSSSRPKLRAKHVRVTDIVPNENGRHKKGSEPNTVERIKNTHTPAGTYGSPNFTQKNGASQA